MRQRRAPLQRRDPVSWPANPPAGRPERAATTARLRIPQGAVARAPGKIPVKKPPPRIRGFPVRLAPGKLAAMAARLAPLLALVIVALATARPPAAHGAAKSVACEAVPAYTPVRSTRLAGRTHGLDTTATRLLVYACRGGRWYAAPEGGQPAVALAGDGAWSTTIPLPPTTSPLTNLSVLAVPTSFVPGPVDGAEWIPDTITEAALASAEAVCLNPERRNLRWAGLDWWVKYATGNPGPNAYSHSAENVFVDAEGNLHLRITRTEDPNLTAKGYSWACAEIVTYRTLGYGRYTLRTATSCDALDPNAIFGFFTWSDGTLDPRNREMDIEWARWGDPARPTNAQFVVQPSGASGNLRRLALPSAATELEQWFTWQPDPAAAWAIDPRRVAFGATDGATVLEWTYPADVPAGREPAVPESRDEHVDIDLWLCKGAGAEFARPARDEPVEVVVRSFSFTGYDNDADGMPDTWERAHGLAPHDPADAPRDDDGDSASNRDEFLADTDPADGASVFRITRCTLAGTTPEITFTTRPEKYYDLESTTDLAANWSPVPGCTDLASTSGTCIARTPVPAAGSRLFYRVAVHPRQVPPLPKP